VKRWVWGRCDMGAPPDRHLLAETQAGAQQVWHLRRLKAMHARTKMTAFRAAEGTGVPGIEARLEQPGLRFFLRRMFCSDKGACTHLLQGSSR
jgi:hypothetical protein